MGAWKAVAATLAACGGVAAAAVSGALLLGDQKLARRVDVRVVPVPFTRDAAAVKRGQHLYESRGCAECHGPDGAGRVLVNDADGFYVRAPNLTSGAGSAVLDYGEADWVRAIRHGVDPSGRALLVMPSEDYNRLTDTDLAALVAYVRGFPAKDGARGLVRLSTYYKALYGVGLMLDAAQKADHRKPPPAPVAPGPTVDYGAYIAAMCVGCHGENLAGGHIRGGMPGWPPAANLTPGDGSGMAAYENFDAFAAMMRTGRRPDGTSVSTVMPFASLRYLDDVELRALHAYLLALPARPFGSH